MKKFIVSKSDTTKVDFVKKAILDIAPPSVFILAEKDRIGIFKDIEAKILPLKELNKNSNWIEFNNTFDAKNSLLVIDNVLKFIFFGDGKKAYLKDLVQSFENIIVMDVVPFYSDPSEIFYPFWFLGKSILGYNSYNTFKSNHKEEGKDGSIDYAHSFEILKDKIKDYYIQDYDCFFNNFSFATFKMSDSENDAYEKQKQKSKDEFTNPIKFYNDISPFININQSRYDAINLLLKRLDVKKTVLVNNSASYQLQHKKKIKFDVNYLTFHSNIDEFDAYENVVFIQMPIVKPMNFYYIAQKNKNFYQIALEDNKLESFYKEKIYNNELRQKIDATFYNADLLAAS